MKVPEVSGKGFMWFVGAVLCGARCDGSARELCTKRPENGRNLASEKRHLRLPGKF